ncbi:MAG: hypothetical protein Ct9H300mP28_07910 [Pseudomonadota bacterium]|nr:MAG: hypothetical protein Ct9H300mP28_07910 [Pseudomonadota bacterium]
MLGIDLHCSVTVLYQHLVGIAVVCSNHQQTFYFINRLTIESRAASIVSTA